MGVVPRVSVKGETLAASLAFTVVAHVRESALSSTLPHSTLCSQEKALVSSSGRVNRANQRRLASVFSSGDISSDLAKYNQLKVCYSL